MFVHNVYFWLKPGLDGEARDSFAEGLDTLTRDPAAKGGHYGEPAATDRGVVDNSYSYGLIVVFDDLAAHDRYQAGAVHLDFLAAHSAKWERVVVYDFETP
jgi:hypothetical protein